MVSGERTVPTRPGIGVTALGSAAATRVAPGITVALEASVSAAPPEGTSFALSRYATTEVTCSALREPAAWGGMVVEISSRTSLTGRPPHVFRKFGPAS